MNLIEVHVVRLQVVQTAIASLDHLLILEVIGKDFRCADPLRSLIRDCLDKHLLRMPIPVYFCRIDGGNTSLHRSLNRANGFSIVNVYPPSFASLPGPHNDWGNLNSSASQASSLHCCPLTSRCLSPSMKVSIPVFCFSLLLSLTPFSAQAQSTVAGLNQQLQDSVHRQNWSEAIQVIDQLIPLAPEQAAQLKQYRSQLKQLQQTGFKGSSSKPASAKKATSKVGLVPIKRRSGGVAIVDVRFNSRRTFEMLVDSGASRTVITRPMAKALGIGTSDVVGTFGASTANGYAEFPIVYVKAMEVGGLKSYQVPVAVAGPDMDMGLLGQDFLQKYDFTFRGNQIEFHKR